MVDEQRPSTIKTRIIAHSQLVVRADRELRTPVNGQTEKRIIEKLKDALADAAALIVSDYDKGVVTPRILSGDSAARVRTHAGADRSQDA